MLPQSSSHHAYRGSWTRLARRMRIHSSRWIVGVLVFLVVCMVLYFPSSSFPAETGDSVVGSRVPKSSASSKDAPPVYDDEEVRMLPSPHKLKQRTPQEQEEEDEQQFDDGTVLRETSPPPSLSHNEPSPSTPSSSVSPSSPTSNFDLQKQLDRVRADKTNLKDQVQVPGWTMYRPLNTLIRAWENMKVDWHMLVPASRTGNDALDFERLVNREAKVMEILLNSRDSIMHGPANLRAFNPDVRFCRHFNDKCVIHRDEQECVSDGLCHWCASSSLCVSRRAPVPGGVEADYDALSLCPQPPPPVKLPEALAQSLDQEKPLLRSSMQGRNVRFVRFTKGRGDHAEIEYFGPDNRDVESTLRRVFAPDTTISVRRNEKELDVTEGCDAFVEGTTYLLPPQNNIGMYWHFLTEYLSGLLHDIDKNNPSRNHFFSVGQPLDVLFDWFGLMGLSCYRNINQLEGRVCFEHISSRKPSEGASVGLTNSWVPYAVNKLGLQDFPKLEANRKPVVGFVSRRDKRIIVNEPELVALAREMGCEVRILDYEQLGVELQVAGTRELDVLIGIHGSGLLNSILLRKKTAEVQVLPPGLRSGHITSCYVSTASMADVRYYELPVDGVDNAVKHWHFVHHDMPHKFTRESVNQRGDQALPSEGLVRVLMIQQDTRVPLEQFRRTLQQVLNERP